MSCQECKFGWVLTSQGAKPCECSKAAQREKLFEKACIPARYKHCTIDNYQPQGSPESNYFLSQVTAKVKAETIIREFPAEQGLLLQGPCGVGKTHLAVGILRALIERNMEGGLFCDLTALFTKIQSTWNPHSSNTTLDVLTPILQAPYLVLDELGGVRTSQWSQDILMQVVNTRYTESLLTIVTTNYLDTEAGSAETLTDRVGERLRSRLKQMARTVQILGADYRDRYQHAA